MYKIDLKDRKILSLLDLNARMPLTKLARKVALSRQVVEYRIKRLREEKVILGVKAVFDSAVVGYNWYRVMLRLLNINKEQKAEIISYLKNHPHVFWLGEVGEDWDIVVNFVCKDNFQFNKIFEEVASKYGAFILDYEVLIYLNVYDLERSYLLEKKETRKNFFHEMRTNSKIQLDQLDREIIKVISQDAWISNLQLGQKLKVSGNTIKNRIEEMQKNKLLLGFRLFLNPSVLGYQSFMLFLKVNRLNLEREKMLFAYFKTNPNITFAVKQMGDYRIGLEIETKTVQEFQDIFIEIRGKFSDMITDFDSFPLFKDHKINYFPEGCLEE
ncbi:MAG: Lrp/AsnC family transcriptional regulator [Candidatus Woesearchaeota archaeon]|jgi:DNA-binding Lrp family transcriptional regulator